MLIIPGNRILAIDGVEVTGRSLDEVIDLLRGDTGSVAEIRVETATRESKVVMLRRAIVLHDAPQVALAGGVILLTLDAFYSDTPAQIVEALGRLKLDDATGCIIDLRHNGGGILLGAIDAADLFIETGVILSEQGRDLRDRETFRARGGDLLKGLPIVMIVDRETGSGAEIFAAALRHNRAARLVGEHSAGRGTISTVAPLSARAALKIETARIFLANGQPLEPTGLVPDVMLGTAALSGEKAIAVATALLAESRAQPPH